MGNIWYASPYPGELINIKGKKSPIKILYSNPSILGIKKYHALNNANTALILKRVNEQTKIQNLFPKFNG